MKRYCATRHAGHVNALHFDAATGRIRIKNDTMSAAAAVTVVVHDTARPNSLVGVHV